MRQRLKDDTQHLGEVQTLWGEERGQRSKLWEPLGMGMGKSQGEGWTSEGDLNGEERDAEETMHRLPRISQTPVTATEVPGGPQQESIVGQHWQCGGREEGGRRLGMWPQRGEGNGMGAEGREGRKETLTAGEKWAALWA